MSRRSRGRGAVDPEKLSIAKSEPSILTRYWWYGRDPTTTPVLSQCLARLPVCPGCSGGRDFVCSDHCLSASAYLRLRACSQSSRFCFHILCGAYLPGMRSRTGLPNTHIAGDSLVAGSGVLPVLEDGTLERICV